MLMELPDHKWPPTQLMEGYADSDCDVVSIKSESSTATQAPSGKSAAAFAWEQHLIQLVSAQPALYDRRHARFKDDAYKELLWQLIANKLRQESSKCMSTWAELRHSYQQHVQRQRLRRKRGRRRVACLPHEEQLLFLYPHVARQPLQRLTTAQHTAKVAKVADNDDDDDDDEVTIVAPQPAIIIDVDKDAYDEYELSADQLRLIKAVHAYPQLYDVQHAGYENHRHRGLIWGAISNELHEKATKLMKSWLQLQMRYEWELTYYKDSNEHSSRLTELLAFLEPHVHEQQGSVCKLSVYLRSAWHDPIEHFRSVLNLINVLRTLPELTQMVDDYQHCAQKPLQYHELWSRVASQVNESHQRCEVSWLVLRQFYRDLAEMRIVGYQLQDKWFFENIIASLYKQQATRQARRGCKRSASISRGSPPLPKRLASSDEVTFNDNGPKGLAVGEKAPPLPLAIVYPLSQKAAIENANSNGSNEESSNTNSNSSSSSSSSSSSCSSTSMFVLPRIDAAISVVRAPEPTVAATSVSTSVPATVAATPAPATSIITVVPNSSLYPPGSDKANDKSSSSNTNLITATSANQLDIGAHVVKKPSRVKLISLPPKPLTVRNDKVPMPCKLRTVCNASTAAATATSTTPTTSAAALQTIIGTLTGSGTGTGAAKGSVTLAGTSIKLATVARTSPDNSDNSSKSSQKPNSSKSNNSKLNNSLTIRTTGANPSNSPANTFNIRSSSSTISIQTSSDSNKTISVQSVNSSSSNSSSNSNNDCASSSMKIAKTTPAPVVFCVEFRDCPTMGRILYVLGSGVPPQANLNMSRTAVFIREVLAIPQLHSKEPQLLTKINDLWLQLSKKLHLPDFVCRGIWSFLSHNINLFPQIAPMVDLMRPFKTTLKVWEKSHRLFSKFDEIARKYQWMLHKHELPALMQHFRRYEHLYWELRRPRPGETPNAVRPSRVFTEQERNDVWRVAKENFPQMNHRDVWSMFKFAFKTYMEDLERGIENPWPQNWWHALEQLKFLVNVRYHPLDPYYYIVHNKFMEEVKRCSMYEALMQPTDDNADVLRTNKHKMPTVKVQPDPMPWETEEAKRLLVGKLSQAINLYDTDSDSEPEQENEQQEQQEMEVDVEWDVKEQQQTVIKMDDDDEKDCMLNSQPLVAELAQFIGNDPRQFPSIDGFQLTATMRRHSTAYGVASPGQKRTAWLRIAKELNSTVNECRLSLQHMLRQQRIWRISDPSGRCTLSSKYFRHMTDIYREVKFGHKPQRVANTPGDETEDTLFPERYIPDINAVTSPPSLVVKNWSYAIGHFPLVIQEELRTRLRFTFAKYERLAKQN